MWAYGTQWKGPYAITAGSPMPLNLELDLLTAPLRNEWSVIVWAEKTQVKIAHSDNYPSDAWPLQKPFELHTHELIPDPTPEPTPTTNMMDDFVANLTISPYYQNCKSYASGYKKTSAGGSYKYRKWYGHLCSTKSLKLQLKFRSTEKS